jgi:hypothetical protein
MSKNETLNYSRCLSILIVNIRSGKVPEKQQEMKLNGLNQTAVCANDVDLFNEDAHTTKKLAGIGWDINIYIYKYENNMKRKSVTQL